VVCCVWCVLCVVCCGMVWCGVVCDVVLLVCDVVLFAVCFFAMGFLALGFFAVGFFAVRAVAVVFSTGAAMGITQSLDLYSIVHNNSTEQSELLPVKTPGPTFTQLCGVAHPKEPQRTRPPPTPRTAPARPAPRRPCSIPRRPCVLKRLVSSRLRRGCIRASGGGGEERHTRFVRQLLLL
jgi:hypothetical protein